MADTVVLMRLADEIHKYDGTATTYLHASFTQEVLEMRLKSSVGEVLHETV